MTDKSPMGDMALNKALSKWTTHNTPPRELSAFVDGFAAASVPLLARIAELKAQVAAENGKINVLVDILRDVLMPLSVSKMDAMTSGEEDDYQMIANLEKRIKSAIHGATP